MVTIRHCRTDDVADVLAFLEVHWKPGHIFTVHPALFEWQHALPGRPGEFSMAIARRTTDQALLGILGYIPTRRFDPSLAGDNSIWLALWKVRDDAGTAGLGLGLLNYVTDSEPYEAIGVIGFQAEVRPIYQALGFTVGELRHYAMPNPDVDRFELATFSTRSRAPIRDARVTASPVDPVHLTELAADLDIEARHARQPGKTAGFFLERYLRHPIYRYRCELISRDGRAIGLLATRIATHAGRAALRVIDYLGPDDAVPELGAIVDRQMRDAGAEYADVYNWGIDDALFRQAGFREIDPDGSDVVPDHFEPFEARNVRIRFAVKASRPVVLFKGDGDQDRPQPDAAMTTPETRQGSLVTIVMYHFVRPAPAGGFSRFAALDPAAFREQLRYVRRHYSPVRLADVVASANGAGALPPHPIVLTFDDGYRDHYAHVFPLLVDQGLPAAFFPVRSALVDRRILDTNKVHFILAAAPAADTIVAAVDRAIEASHGPAIATVEDYRSRWWAASRFDGPDVVYVKRMLQHGLPDDVRRPLVDALFERYVTSDEADFAAGLYLTVGEAREMLSAGMEFGGHGDRHIPLTALTPDAQAREIDGALETLQEIGAARTAFAYSYVKGEHDATSEALLRARGCAIALTTREALVSVGVDPLIALPRIDTTRLPVDGGARPNEWTARALA